MAKWEFKDINITDDNTDGTEPVTVDEVKDFLQREGTAWDGPIDIFITAARKKIEQYCNVSLVPKEITAFIRNPSYAPFPLPYPPIASVTSVAWKQCPSQLIALVNETDYDIDLNYNAWINSSEKDSNTYNFHKVVFVTSADGSIAYKQAIIAQAGWMVTQRDESGVSGWAPAALAICNTLRNVLL